MVADGRGSKGSEKAKRDCYMFRSKEVGSRMSYGHRVVATQVSM
jgi:hypothetical protein